MYWPEDAHLWKQPEPRADGGCINEECCGTRRNLFIDEHGGNTVCDLCGTVQSTHQNIVYAEEKRTFGEDKDGEKGGDHRRTSVVMDRKLADLSKPPAGKKTIVAPPTLALVAAIDQSSLPASHPASQSGDDCSSVSSVSTEESEESDGDGDADKVRWQLQQPALQWGTTR